MRVIIGGQYYPTLEGSSVSITRAISDPVPTCTLNLRDNDSTLTPQGMQEILVLDDQVIPNPTVNMLQNPALTGATGLQYAVINPTTSITITGTSPGNQFFLGSGSPGQAYLSQSASAIAGQTYLFSAYMDISTAFSNGSAFIEILFLDGASNVLTSGQQTLTLTTPVASTVRISVQSVAPTSTAFVQIRFGANATSTTPSGTVLFTQLQLEPLWFPTLSYPTPWCGPAQTNCQQLPLGLWIRQYRKFAGFVNHVVAQDYHGNTRTLVVNAVGYAWLASLILGNDSFTSKTDAQIITTLLGKYFLSNGTAMCTTTNVVTGVTLANMQLNWDDLRTGFDSLAGDSGYYWTIDYYWNFVYAPPGYYSMQISLICDNSSTPDLVTTYPAYNFSVETDYTQPGSNILVIGGTSGSTTFTSQVIDPSVIAQLGITSGYMLPTTTSWMRKVTDSTLQSNADCTTRGMAELLQYDKQRLLIHLSTNVELIAGYGVAITSSTDGLNTSTQLIQQVTATWLGTDETLTDVWEYQADLGAANRAATNMISRIFRQTQRSSSAPAISGITLAVLENVGVVDSIDSNSGYAQTVLSDSPLAYYRLGEPSGYGITTAYDWGGNAYNGTITGGVTLGETGALYNDSNTAMLFDGSTGYISLPTATNGNGLGALSVEGWFNLSTASLGSFTGLIESGAEASNTGFLLFWSGTSTLIFSVGNGTTHARASLATTATANTWLHVVGTYDGANVRLYVNGALVAGPTSLTGSISASAAPVIAGSTGHTTLFPGTIDEVAIYASALSATRISAHYLSGTKGGVR